MTLDKNRPFGIHTVHDMFSPDCTTITTDGAAYRAVAEPYPGNRLTAAWWVLTGRAQALVWPDAGDTEAAMGLPHPKPHGSRQ